jgi:hypothetical protein
LGEKPHMWRLSAQIRFECHERMRVCANFWPAHSLPLTRELALYLLFRPQNLQARPIPYQTGHDQAYGLSQSLAPEEE